MSLLTIRDSVKPRHVTAVAFCDPDPSNLATAGYPNRHSWPQTEAWLDHDLVPHV